MPEFKKINTSEKKMLFKFKALKWRHYAYTLTSIALIATAQFINYESQWSFLVYISSGLYILQGFKILKTSKITDISLVIIIVTIILLFKNISDYNYELSQGDYDWGGIGMLLIYIQAFVGLLITCLLNIIGIIIAHKKSVIPRQIK